MRVVSFHVRKTTNLPRQARDRPLNEEIEKLRVRTYHISQCLPFTTTSAASSTEDALIALG
eukprot:COSAG06_NODE_2131_length_7528_cov_29.514470_1_plen_60_part_10